MLAVLTALVLSASAATDPALLEPRLALVRIDSGSKAKNQPLFLTTHGLVPSSVFATQAKASYTKFWNGTGNSPIRHLAIVDLQGDGADEMVIVRERVKKGSRLDLFVVSMPGGLGTKKPKPIASLQPGALGFATGDGRVVAIETLDLLGDGVDRLAIVRSYLDGHQSLEIRPLPLGKNQPLGDVISIDPLVGYVDGAGPVALGVVGTTEVVGIARARDVNGVDRLAIWRRAPATLSASQATEFLEIVAPPLAPDGALSAPIAGFADLKARDGAALEGVRALEIAPGAETAFLLERAATDGSRRVEFAPPPLVVDAPLVLVSQFALGATGVGNGKSIFAALSFVAQLPAPPPPPPPPPTPIEAAGNYVMFFQYTNPWLCQAWDGCDTIEPGMPLGASYLMGPFTGFSATYEQLNFRLTGPDPNFLLDGTIGKPLAPDPYTNLMLQQLGAPAKLVMVSGNEAGMPPGSQVQFAMYEKNVRVTKDSGGHVVFASNVVGTVAPVAGDPFPLGYVVFVRQ